MKKILICLTVTAFAAMTSLQAGEQSTKDKAACSGQASSSCCSGAKTASTKSACSGAKVAKKTDVKGAVLLVQR